MLSYLAGTPEVEVEEDVLLDFRFDAPLSHASFRPLAMLWQKIRRSRDDLEVNRDAPMEQSCKCPFK